MFCVFLQNTPPKKDLLVTIVHNKNNYTFSRNLTSRHSPILADLLIKNEDDVINLDYFHEFDDFQLICDLFNYKRVFIKHTNIDFLEFAANFLQIQVLINKTTKYRNNYNDFIKNPIFKKIDLLHHQVFSIFKPQTDSTKMIDSDYDYDDNEIDENQNDNNENENNDSNFDKQTNEFENNLNIKENENSNQKINENDKENENQKDNQNNYQPILNEIKNDNDSNIPTIQYDQEYSSTVSHLIFSAIFSNPLNADKYLPIVIKDNTLLKNFIETLTSSPLSISFVNYIIDPLHKYLEGKGIEATDLEKTLNLYQMENINPDINLFDTNLDIYLNDVGYFFKEYYEFYTKYEFLNDLIEKDDIDQFQFNFVSNPKISNRKENFINFFRTSMVTSSIKCFKYFVLNWGLHSSTFKVDAKMIHSAIIGENLEIIRFLFDKYEGSPVDFIKDTILFHKKELFQWMVQKCHFLSLYNSCCSKILYGENFVKQKWYRCKKCHKHHNNGCCKFCAKHCHLDRDVENSHKVEFLFISYSCFCDDECELSKNVEIDGNKKIVEIDDLILLSFYCMNTEAIKILIKEGGYILRCRDTLTKSLYTLNNLKIKELIKNMRGYKDYSTDYKFSKKYIMNFLSLSYSDDSEDDDDDDDKKIQPLPFLQPVDVTNFQNQNDNTTNNDNDNDKS